MRNQRIDRVPPDGWVTELRGIFGIDEDATWADILTECAQTQRLAESATAEFLATQATKALRRRDLPAAVMFSHLRDVARTRKQGTDGD